MKTTIPLKPTINLASLMKTAANALDIVNQVRSNMFAPNSHKASPLFTSSRLAGLCGIEKSKMAYHLKKQTLPGGTKDGARLEFSLDDAQQWIKKFRADKLRDAKTSAGVVITVANFKGGVGKTSTAAVLAQGLNLRGHKVLIIDADAQGSISTMMGLDPTDVTEDQTLLPIFTGEKTSILDVLQTTYWSGVDIVAAGPALYNAEFILPSRQKTEKGFEFWKVLENSLVEALDIYDAIIIDSPPSLSYITINTLLAANGLVMPLPPNALDFASSAQFWNLFTELFEGLYKDQDAAKKYYFIDILLSRVDKADVVSAAVRNWIIAAYGGNVLPIEIPKTSIAATASAEFGTVYDLDPSSTKSSTLIRARDAYDLFVDYIEMQMIGIWSNDSISNKQGNLK
ncbi:ParA family protein [Rhodoferax antarcticus]|uniref:CobQ/CobB/MinD/ParA nucleotide binding domain protein n=1 Tax=Rhodoferax antarcticus ANT.BR TaxID=1111071 RepID=A0A1Q8Y9M9_9BURK|nr:AAA family ATPase [Rhodoferax antarcticus]OLP04647.1 CobQ/CobB/MinD/ParA nucleotide binding domain protein [Rhodoferax antarcticus ANT.BR]